MIIFINTDYECEDEGLGMRQDIVSSLPTSLPLPSNKDEGLGNPIADMTSSCFETGKS